MKIKALFAATALSVLVSGCSSIPAPQDRSSMSPISPKEMGENWVSSPAITNVNRSYNLSVYEPGRIPDNIQSKPVHTHASSYITTEDLAFMLGELGVQAVVSSKEIENSSVYVPRYSGTVGSFLEMLSSVSGMDFRWVGNTLIIDDSKQYIIKIEQQKDIASSISNTLSGMGAEDISASPESGTVSYTASSKEQVVISNYLDRLATNTSVIELQVAVVTVRLTDERNTGFDWSRFAAEFGDSNLLDIEGKGILGNLSGSSFGLTFGNSSLSAVAAFNLLSTYGESKTTQNLTIQTLSGVPVQLRSGDKIPYIADIPTTTSENSTTSGLKTENVETGFQIDLDALYDHEEEIVTISMDLSLKSLIGFIDLSAGNQLGTITQPQVQEQYLNNIVKLKAGESSIIGGLVIENFSDNRQNLSVTDRLPFGSKSMDSNRTAIYIMLRPTVTVFGGGEA